jgi:putative transposase
MFTTWVDYFAKIRGVHVMSVAPHFTSEDGSDEKKIRVICVILLIRVTSCGLIEHRDLNAAKNILAAQCLGIKSTVGHTETNKLGETDPLVCVEKSTAFC